MKPSHVEIIVAIADAGSLRAAAGLVGKTQPALTKALRQAEDALGARIFTRAARGVEPTAIGKAVIARARELRAEGLSLRAIGRALLDEGRLPRSGKRWHVQVVKRLAGE